jgi:formylglycine-generating enzyme required for sulfatase activity
MNDIWNDIFLSHDTQDRERVLAFRQRLMDEGFTVFCSSVSGSIPIGRQWHEKVIEEYDRSHLLVVLWTKASIRSGSVRSECAQAANDGKLVQVVLDTIREIEIPMGDHYNDQRALFVNWDCRRDHESWPDFVAALRSRLVECTRRGFESGANRDHPRLPELVDVLAGQVECGTTLKDRRTPFHAPHRITISQPFAVGRTPVTVAEFNAQFDPALNAEFGRSASGGQPKDGHDNLPVTYVDWYEAKRYAEWLRDVTGNAYRLLSEAEWEYACRAGVGGRQFSWGDDLYLGPSYANCDWSQTYNGHRVNEGHVPRLLPVNRPGLKQNDFGLLDMSGNVWEWVEDSFAVEFSKHCQSGAALIVDGSEDGVIRGGGWNSPPAELSCAMRRRWHKRPGKAHIGFRVARSLKS